MLISIAPKKIVFNQKILVKYRINKCTGMHISHNSKTKDLKNLQILTSDFLSSYPKVLLK